MRRLLASYLDQFSIASVDAEDGQQALLRLKEEGPVDFALVDWDMPVMSGLEFVRAVRADHSHDGMKLLMVTAHNSLEDVCQAIELGANDFLMKPFDDAMVADKLRVLGLLE